MLAFESLTPEALLKEIAEFLRMEALRQDVTVTILDRKAKLTRLETISREKAESVVNALRRAANDLEGAAIIPANSILRQKSSEGKPYYEYPVTTIPAGELIASTHDPSELYVTEVEEEAYNLAGQIVLAQCRSHVSCRTTNAGTPFWVVVVDAPEAYDRAREIRKRMFGS